MTNRLRPERRTRVDLIVTVAIVVVVAVVAALAWWVSPSRHTTSASSDVPLRPAPTATAAPASLRPGWSAPSSATAAPVVTDAAVVTGDGGTVAAHDPATGAVRWSYRRDLPLCGVVADTAGDPTVVAAYRNSRGCGEVTSLTASDGRRAGSRSSLADSEVRLSAASDYVLAQGPTRLESWGSNLVRGVEYGRVSAPVKPGTQPRSGCRIDSAATGSDQIAVVERCPDDDGYRLTVFAGAQDKDEKVAQSGSRIVTTGLAGAAPRVVAVTSSAVALYMGDGTPRIAVFGGDAALRSTHEVLGAPDAPSDSVPVAGDGLVSFFTGRAAVVLDSVGLTPLYQIPGALGPADTMGADLIVPGPSGITVVDPATGRQRRAIAVARPGYTGGTVTLTPIGNDVVTTYGGRVHMLTAS